MKLHSISMCLNQKQKNNSKGGLGFKMNYKLAYILQSINFPKVTGWQMGKLRCQHYTHLFSFFIVIFTKNLLVLNPVVSTAMLPLPLLSFVLYIIGYIPCLGRQNMENKTFFPESGLKAD